MYTLLLYSYLACFLQVSNTFLVNDRYTLVKLIKWSPVCSMCDNDNLLQTKMTGLFGNINHVHYLLLMLSFVVSL